MVQINYVNERDELEILFKKVDVPEVITLSSGISLEFTSDSLSAIILPNFFQMAHIQPTKNIKFLGMDENILKLELNKQKFNIKINLLEVENQ